MISYFRWPTWSVQQPSPSGRPLTLCQPLSLLRRYVRTSRIQGRRADRVHSCEVVRAQRCHDVAKRGQLEKQRDNYRTLTTSGLLTSKDVPARASSAGNTCALSALRSALPHSTVRPSRRCSVIADGSLAPIEDSCANTAGVSAPATVATA